MRKSVFILIMLMNIGVIYSQQPLSLEECRALALLHNKTIQIAHENVKAAEELTKMAFAQFFPNISAFGKYTWNEKNVSLMSHDAYLPVGVVGKDGSFGVGTPTAPPKSNGDGTFDIEGLAINNKFAFVDGKPVPLDADGKPFDPKANPEKLQWKNYALLPKDAMSFDMKHIFVGGISFVQPIFMGGKIVQLHNIAKASHKVAQAKELTQKENLMISVDEAYWRVVSVENKLKLAKEYHALIAKLDSNMVAMLSEGVVTKADVLKVKVKLNEAEVSLTKAENGLKLSQMALNQLCGKPLNDSLILADTPLEEQLAFKQSITMEEVWSKRPEIDMLTQALNIAEANRKITLGRFLPTVAITGNYLMSNPNSFDGYEKKFGGMFTVGVSAIVPIFHFGEKIHSYKLANAKLKTAQLELEEAKEKIELQVNQNQFRIVESEKKYIATRKNIDQAEENLSYAQEGFVEGVVTSSDLLMAQTAWLSAKSEYIDAIIELKLNNAYLKKSLGEYIY